MVRLGRPKRGALLPPGAAETVRAFAIFAALLALLGWAAHALAFQEMARIARQFAMFRGLQEASAAAEAVLELGRGPTGLDFSRVRRSRAALEELFAGRLRDRPDLRFIEVRDRFSAPVARSEAPGAIGEAVVARYPLIVDNVPQGEVRVGILEDSIDAAIA